MAERGKGKKCRDCANWKVKGSHCTYYDAIMRRRCSDNGSGMRRLLPKRQRKTQIAQSKWLCRARISTKQSMRTGNQSFSHIKDNSLSII